MNKMKLMAPALVAGLLLTACGAETPTDTTAPAATDPAAAAAPPAPANVAPAAQAVVAAYSMAAGAAVAGHCALDTANGMHGPTVSAPLGSKVLFGGWAATEDKEVPTGALFVLGNGANSHAVPLVAGALRPDVAAALGSEALANSGYNLEIDLAGVPAGSYDLVVVLDQASSTHCNLGTRLVLE